MNLKRLLLVLATLSLFSCGAWQSLEPSSSSFNRSTLVGTSWSTCINLGGQSMRGIVHFNTDTDSTFDIYTYSNSDCSGSPKYYSGTIPDTYEYHLQSSNTQCIPEGPTLKMDILSGGDTQAARFISDSVMHLAKGTPASGCDNPNFLNDFTQPTVFNLSTSLPANPSMPSSLASDMWYSCNHDVNGQGYSIGKLYGFNSNGATVNIVEYYYPATSCDGVPTGVLSDANMTYEYNLTGATPEACLKLTDNGNDTFMPITFPNSPSYSSIQLGDASAGPGCGTTFNSSEYLFYAIGGIDVPSNLPSCSLTPTNDCPP